MNAFKTIREGLRLTQAAIAAPLGCTQGNVSFYEKGQTVPPVVAGRLIDLARSHGWQISYDHVYGDQELPPPPRAHPADQPAAEASHG